MGKKSRERVLAENEAKAVTRMLRVSPQKLNLLAQLIRGKKVATALAARDRSLAGPTAPPDGLCLTGVRYNVDPFSEDIV